MYLYFKAMIAATVLFMYLIDKCLLIFHTVHAPVSAMSLSLQSTESSALAHVKWSQGNFLQKEKVTHQSEGKSHDF